MRNLLILIGSLALVIDLDLVGRLTGAETIFCIVAVVSLGRCPPASAQVAQFYRFALLWMAGAMLSDFFNQSDFEDILRGWAKIVFFVINFTAIRFLVGNDIGRGVALVMALFAASALRTALDVGNEGLNQDIAIAWKYGYGQLASAAAFYVSSSLMVATWARPVAIALPFAAAGVALLLNARNLTGITALAALASTLTAGRRRPLSVPSLAAACVLAIASGVMVINVYEYTAREGLLGREAQDKYIQQSQGKLNIFVGGRTESLASTQAIVDAPILGHGSWARDINYVILMINQLEAAGVDVISSDTESDLIPTHSHLLGAWVEHGIFGAIFWFWALWIAGKALLATIRHPTPLTGLLAFIGFSLIWDILFSPFGLERRVITAAWLYLMILAAEQSSAAHVAEPIARDRLPARRKPFRMQQ